MLNRLHLGYPISTFTSNRKGWVSWIETPNGEAIFVWTPTFERTQDLAESVIEEQVKLGLLDEAALRQREPLSIEETNYERQQSYHPVQV